MSRLGPLLSPILIGRDELLDLADHRIADAAAGHGRLLLLAGEAGIGKSRLIGAIDRKAATAGFRTTGGFVAPQDRDVPAASLLDMARSMTRVAPFADLGRSLLAAVEAAMKGRQAARRLLVLEAVDRIVEAVDRPTLLAFDDLQWTDDLSLEMISELARAARDRPLLLVGAYRSDEVAPGSLLREWRSRLITQRLAEESRLAPLSLDETALMTTLILASGLPAPRDVVLAVYERTDGVPLHIEELLGALSEAHRQDSQAIRDAAVPDTLEDAILYRVGRLSPDAQAVARAGAVIGRCFVPEVLAGIMDVAPETLDSPLHELIEQQVLDPPGLRGLYDYRHQLLRDALYGTLPERERRRLHARAAEFGRELEGASEIHASLHYERAGLGNQAFRSALLGARAAARLSAHREAYGLYRRAVDHLPTELAPDEAARILEEFAIQAAAIEENEAAEAAAGMARSRYLEIGDGPGAVRMLALALGIARREARPFEERIATLDAAVAEASGLADEPEARVARCCVQLEVAFAALDGMDLDRAREAVVAAETDARAVGDGELLLDVASIRGMVEALTGQPEDGLERIGAVAGAARAGGYDDTGVTAYRNGAVIAMRFMDHRRASAWIDEGLRYADAMEQSHCAHVLASTRALVAWADGHWDEAVGWGRQAIADRGCARASGMARWPLGYAALGRGALDEAREHLTVALAFGERSGIPDFELAAVWGLAEAALIGREPALAADFADRALDRATTSGERARFVPFVVTGTRALIAAGRPADAARWVEHAARHLEPLGQVAAPALEHARGLLALADGTTIVARGCLERAVRGWDALGRTWEALWARLDLAACLMRSGRHADAVGLVADVRNRAAELASRPLLERAAQLERQARGRVVEDEPWRPLTIRELEVARLIATGRTNAEIATELGIAPKTVSAHVEHVLAKLGASRRTEIASWVASIGATAGSASAPGSIGRTSVRPTRPPRTTAADAARPFAAAGKR